MSSILIAVLAYSFLGILLIAAFHRKKIGALSARAACPKVNAGGQGEWLLPLPGAGELFRFPGITIRYEAALATRDGRRITGIFDPAALEPVRFPVPERGAYYGVGDRLVIADCLGLFRLAFPVPHAGGPRLLAVPARAPEAASGRIRAGGRGRREAAPFQRTDDLIDHRPYIPGDDPRRINWKLFGHGGDLLIREGDPEPPPHSRLVILVDTQVDGSLYTAEEGRRGVDLLCENALALAAASLDRGMDILAGYTGGGLRGGALAELAEFLAYPAALPLAPAGDSGERPECSELPGCSGSAGRPESPGRLLILALPRSAGEPAALDRALKKQGPLADILFLYRGEGLDEAAAACVRFYRGKGGCHARYIRLP